MPLIDIDFGRDGVPILIGDPSDPKTKNYLSTLKRNAGEGNYEFEPFGFEDEDDEIEDLNLRDEFEDWDDGDDDEDNPATWSNEDWEAFIKDTSPAIWGFAEAAAYFYEKILMPQDLASLPNRGEKDVLNFKVTYEPIEFEYRLSAEEQKEGELIHLKLGDSLSKKEFIDLEKRLLDNIQKWPKARIFHNQLTTFYSQSGDDTKLDAALENMARLFPNYLFGKLALAQRLIAHRKLEEVPALFGQQFSLKAIYPERDTFHISEMVAFHTLMCLYFMEKEDLFSAMTHRHLALGMEIPDEISVNWNVFNKLDDKVIDRVKSYLDEIRDDEIKIKETIIQLTEPTDLNLN